jgi:sterol desaturase/sphingolipid hydroxylase (fatty acid hydroxylase superfamily)
VTPALPPTVADFRVHYRTRYLGPRYRGWVHFAVTSLGSLAAIVVAAALVRSPSLAELATIPAAFLIANFAEYFGHRGPMHHRTRGLGILFDRHARQHHRFFTADAMAVDSSRDFHMVLFPPVMLLFFLGAIAVPIGALLYLAISPNVGFLFAATGVSYFLTYEWLHFAYHQPEDGVIGRMWLVRKLRRLHTVHHHTPLMTTANFNITFPIADRVMGTLRRSIES